MDRREFMRQSALTGAGLMVARNSLGAASNSFSGKKPNLVLLVLDDAGWGDLGCYGQKRFTTPNIDRAASQGVRFIDFYSGSAVCAPSRCTLMTGLHTGHAPIRANTGTVTGEGEMPLPADAVTLPRLLAGAGYCNGAFGKWGLGYPGSVGDPMNQGFHRFFGYNGQMPAHNYYPKYLWRDNKKIALDGKTYSHDLIMEEAMKFIRENASRPFFCYLPVTVPHASLHVPEDSARPFRKQFPQFEMVPGIYAGPVIRNPAACFAGMMTRLDGQVGRLMALLAELGIDGQTLFMLTSDNGPHKEGGAMPDFFDSNGPFRGYKRDLYEGGIRVPFIARWPERIPAGGGTEGPTAVSLPGTGRVCGHVSAFWDILPTVCEAVGLTVPSGLDGISMLPALFCDTAEQRDHDYLYWEFNEQGGKQAVRTGNWKGVRLNTRAEPNGPVAVYDLGSDLGESNNLAAAKPDLAARVTAIMKEAHTDPVETQLLIKRK